MQIDKDMVLQLLRSQGKDDQVGQADSELPSQVDTDQRLQLAAPRIQRVPAQVMASLVIIMLAIISPVIISIHPASREILRPAAARNIIPIWMMIYHFNSYSGKHERIR